KLTKTGKPNNSAELANEFKATAVLPYVKGLSEQRCRCLQQQGVRAVFKPRQSQHAHHQRLPSRYPRPVDRHYQPFFRNFYISKLLESV
ncbi:hypothetical protein pdam_00025182, partial [Pocillopora damicornis]